MFLALFMFVYVPKSGFNQMFHEVYKIHDDEL